MSDTLTFTIGNGTTQPKVNVTVSNLGGGQFQFNIVQDCSAGNLVGDLRAFYIDWDVFNAIVKPTLTNLSWSGADGTVNAATSTQAQAFTQEDIGKTTS